MGFLMSKTLRSCDEDSAIVQSPGEQKNSKEFLGFAKSMLMNKTCYHP